LIFASKLQKPSRFLASELQKLSRFLASSTMNQVGFYRKIDLSKGIILKQMAHHTKQATLKWPSFAGCFSEPQ